MSQTLEPESQTMSNVTDNTDGNPAGLAAILAETQATHILQVGLSTPEEQDVLIQAINQTENASLSVITLTGLPVGEREARQVDGLKQRAREEEIEIIETEAVKALPDFYFQNRRFDFAVISTSGTPLQALVAFYYIDRIMKKGGNLVVRLPERPALLKLARYIATETSYRHRNHTDATNTFGKLRELARERLSRLPDFLKTRLQTLVHPDLLLTDTDLGLTGSYAWFTKSETDTGTGGEIDYEEQLNMDFDTLLDSIMNEKG